MIEIAAFLLITAISSTTVVSAAAIVTIRRHRAAYQRRLNRFPPHLRNLQFAAVADDAVQLAITTAGARGFPSPDQFRELTPSAQMLYRARLRERINLAGAWQITLTTVATILLSIVAVRAIEWVPRWFAFGSEAAWPQVLIGMLAPALGLIILSALIATPAVSTIFSRERKRTAERLLDQYEIVSSRGD